MFWRNQLPSFSVEKVEAVGSFKMWITIQSGLTVWILMTCLQQKSKWCNQHIITQLSELLQVCYKYYDWQLWYTWECELHFCISGPFQMWMYCCVWDMETYV